MLRHNPATRPATCCPSWNCWTWAAPVPANLLGLTAQRHPDGHQPGQHCQLPRDHRAGLWRLYALRDDSCVIEPFGTLQARTLDGHAAFMLVTDWLLRENLPAGPAALAAPGAGRVPVARTACTWSTTWPSSAAGPGAVRPPLIDAILAAGVRSRPRPRPRDVPPGLLQRLPDGLGTGGRTRAAWRPCARFLDWSRGGADLDEAAAQVYGVDLNGLARSARSGQLGEPIGRMATRVRANPNPTLTRARDERS